jgi:hypothetical protein
MPRRGIDHRIVRGTLDAVSYIRGVTMEGQSMQKLTLIVALALGAAASPALACDWNKEAKADTQTIATEQPADESPVQQDAAKTGPAPNANDGTVVADSAQH